MKRMLQLDLSALPSVVLLTALLTHAPAVAQDVLVLEREGAVTNVKVLNATWEEVEYRVGRRTKKTAPASAVARMERDSTYLNAIHVAMTTASYKRAVEAIEELDPQSGKPKPWEESEAAYLLAEAYKRLGEEDKAEAAFKAYLEKGKDTKDWWVPYAVRRLADRALGKKQPGTAEVLYKDLQRYGGQWEARAFLGQGKALLLKGKSRTQEARKMFNDVLRVARDPALKQEARVERIRAIVIAEQYGQAVNDLKANFFDAPKAGEFLYGEARARATLLMAKAYSGQEGTENQQQAELWLQQVVSLYRYHTGVFEEACDELVKVYEAQGKSGRAAYWKKQKPTKR